MNASVASQTFGDIKVPGHDFLTWDETILTGLTLVAGTIMGKITASGKLRDCDQDASDGSQTAHSILVEDVDTTSGDKKRPVYVKGVFNMNSLTLLNPSSSDIETSRDELRLQGIYLVDSVPN